MDVREKLVDVFDKIGCEKLEKAAYSQSDCERLISDLIAHGVTVQAWISVKDRLPEDNERVLVYHDDGVIRFGINKGGFADVVSSLYLTHNHRTCFSKVTHWMPLPLPPKGE